MLCDHRVTLDELLAASATLYTAGVGVRIRLLGLSELVSRQLYRRHRSGAAAQLDGTAGNLSFSTLSGVGLSDIVPISAPARALAMMEMFGGVMYIAVVVSRLIALTTLRMRRD